MKKSLSFVMLTICLLVHNILPAKNVVAYLTSASFNVPGKGPYYETYLSVIGSSLKFVKNASGKYQGAVDITIQFKQGEEVKNAAKYSLNSPEIPDTLNGYPNFIDQQRYSLANGVYNVEISIADKNHSGTAPLVTKFDLTVKFPDDLVAMSDIQMLESYTKSSNPNQLTKSGYDLVPYVSSYYPSNVGKIKFYAELYNAKKILGEGEKMLISYYIENYDTKVKLNDFSAFSKQVAGQVNIVLAELNIESLLSGNYSLVIELRDKDNKIQAEQRVFIQRSNKAVQAGLQDLKAIDVNKTFVSGYKNLDTMMMYLRCLRPISSTTEVDFMENQLKEKNLLLMQQYFYNFWASRYPLTPETSWFDYYKEVQKVNAQFGTYGLKGYDTDRGRVYLQYGPPDQRNKMDIEPSSYPYEIWEYYTLVDKTQMLSNPNNRQSSKKFVFYMPDNVSNKYRLLHSTAKGEVNNPSWDMVLHKRDTPGSNFDNEKSPDHFGGSTNDTFNNPR